MRLSKVLFFLFCFLLKYFINLVIFRVLLGFYIIVYRFNWDYIERMISMG